MNSFFETLADMGHKRWFRWLAVIVAIPAAINIPLALILTHWQDAFEASGAVGTALVLFALSADDRQTPAVSNFRKASQ